LAIGKIAKQLQKALNPTNNHEKSVPNIYAQYFSAHLRRASLGRRPPSAAHLRCQAVA
jgi:hypothetical protein